MALLFESFSERKFIGAPRFLVRWYACFLVVQWFWLPADTTFEPTWPELLRFFVLRPVWFGGLLFLLCAMFARVARFSLGAIAAGMTRYIPWMLLLVGVRLLGAALSWPIIPIIGLDPSLCFGLVLASFGIGYAVSIARASRASGVWFGFGAFFVGIAYLLFPRFLGWLVGGGDEPTMRALISYVRDGYWWDASYDRFGTSLDHGEAGMAVDLFLGAWVFVCGGILACGNIVSRCRTYASAWIQHLRVGEFALHAGLVCLGLGFAFIAKPGVDGHFASWLAVSVLILSLGLAWLVATSSRDLVFLSQDEEAGKNVPLVVGAVTPAMFEEVRVLCGVFACIGSCLLGWPIFCAVMIFLLIQMLRYESAFDVFGRVWASVWAGLGGVVWLFIGWFFGSRSVSLIGIPMGVWIGAGLSVALVMWMREKRLLGLPPWFFTIPIFLSPVLAMSVRWVLVAIPFALAVGMVVPVSTHKQRAFDLFLVGFYFVSGLLFASGWLIS